MKEIKLSQRNKKSENRHLVAMVDDEDYDFLNQWNWSTYKHRNTFYAHRVDTTGTKRVKIRMHRLIMKLNNNNVIVDHIDCNGLNNQKSNLRIATSSQNSMNRLPVKKNTSSVYKGVHLHKGCGKWAAGIGHRRKTKHLGLFVNEIDAAKAYNKAAINLYGEFANLNVL